MLDKLEFLKDVEQKYQQLNKEISDPEVIANQDKWQGLMKEHARLEPIIERYQEYKKSEQAIADSKEML
ncbi:MAG: PCRF domain-containing protein, partial [Eubacteriaceae bacterium]|nr:PCRF domain-containing protein [Eubacteriaceae bacterium]